MIEQKSHTLPGCLVKRPRKKILQPFIKQKDFNLIELSIVLVILGLKNIRHSVARIFEDSKIMTTESQAGVQQRGHPAFAGMTGFSLVELSIVLVILGLLIGGILTGQSLIRAAELRNVTTEFQRYQTAVMTFRDKYFALPGDMANATDFWGAAHATASTCATTASSGSETCDGDGNGDLEVDAVTIGTMEIYRFWQHLANAGLIEGSYTGISTPSGNDYSTVRGENIPASKIGNGSWSVASRRNLSEKSGWYLNMFLSDATNRWFIIGRAWTLSNVPIFSTEEAWNIDTKMDDGKPGLGNVTTFNTQSFNPDCASSDTAATAEYSLTNSGSNLCTLLLGF